MINKDKTLTVGMLISALKDGRLTTDMPIAIYDAEGTMRGINAFELQTMKDGTQGLTFFVGAYCASIADVASTSEVFP
jgi:hypothetical protein